MLVQSRFDAGVCPAVDAELLVSNQVLFFGQVLVDLGLLWLEEQIVRKDTGTRMLLPVERGIRVAITFHFLLSI